MPQITGQSVWVILDGKNIEWETVENKTLYRTACWWHEAGTWCYYDPENVFDTELAARNELEKRLYAKAESLRLHREKMSRLLVNCAPPITKAKEQSSYPEQDYFCGLRPLETDW